MGSKGLAMLSMHEDQTKSLALAWKASGLPVPAPHVQEETTYCLFLHLLQV